MHLVSEIYGIGHDEKLLGHSEVLMRRETYLPSRITPIMKADGFLPEGLDELTERQVDGQRR